MQTPLHVGESEKKVMARRKRANFIVRVNVFFFASFALFSILVGQLALLQFVHGEELSAQENSLQKADVRIAPIRGNIYDLHGFPLAYTVSSHSLFYQIGPGQNRDSFIALAYRLEEILAMFPREGGEEELLTAEEILKRMDVGVTLDGTITRSRNYTYQPRRIKANLTQEEIAYLAEHRDELPGVEVTEESTRKYDEQTIAVQLIGYLRPYSYVGPEPRSFLSYYTTRTEEERYLNDEYVGFDGLEFLYQEELRGKFGEKSYLINNKSQIIGQTQLTPPVKGNNLHLTIHKDVQLAAENKIESHLAYMKSPAAAGTTAARGRNAVAGYAVAMEVDSGKVVAMASFPDYDPNIWSKRQGRIFSEDLKAIENKMTNGTIRQRYPDLADPTQRNKHPGSLVPLGSTMKPLTVLVGLNEGVIRTKETYLDPTTFYFGAGGKSKISNSGGSNYGRLNAERAIHVSSNTFMAEAIGNRMYFSRKYPRYSEEGNAVDVWDSYMKKFGLGVLTGSGLPGEIEGVIEYNNEAKNGSPQSALIYASFGQMGRYTTLQLAQYTTMLANRGKRYKPIFVDKITTYDGELIRRVEPEILNEEHYPDEYWEVLERGMSRVGVAGFDGVTYSFNRKTGTSEQQVAGGVLVDNAVLIAYAPADKPKLAVAVVVPEGGFGSQGAAPIARAIFDAYDQYIGLDGTPKGPPQQVESDAEGTEGEAVPARAQQVRP